MSTFWCVYLWHQHSRTLYRNYILWKKSFLLLYRFCNCVFSSFLFSFGNSFLNIDFTFLASINSASGNLKFVFVFGVTWYTIKYCSILSTDSFPSDFFNAHLKVSTNISAWRLDRNWYGTAVRCTNEKDYENLLTLVTNCMPLSDTIVSGIPKLAKSSCKNFIPLHLKILLPLAILKNSQRQSNSITPLLDMQNQ